MPDPDDPADRVQRRLNAIHHISGVTINCCETGETDCPCICHDDTDGDDQP